MTANFSGVQLLAQPHDGVGEGRVVTPLEGGRMHAREELDDGVAQRRVPLLLHVLIAAEGGVRASQARQPGPFAEPPALRSLRRLRRRRRFSSPTCTAISSGELGIEPANVQ